MTPFCLLGTNYNTFCCAVSGVGTDNTFSVVSTATRSFGVVMMCFSNVCGCGERFRQIVCSSSCV